MSVVSQLRDLLEECRVKLITPAFTHKRCQMTSDEVTRTCHIAHARIHVECVIRRLKVYQILSQTIPITRQNAEGTGLLNLRAELISGEN